MGQEKVRKLATAAAVSLALASTGAKALILGEIEMRSALNQPIDAEIGLSSIVPGEIEGMIVKLASPEAFARAGIERTRVLTDLRFSVVTGADGEPAIQVSSRNPIQEPFLNFLIDVDWRGGRLVREYTVLLDPPVFMTPNATLRDTSTDTPATVSASADESILTPLPIDRNAAAQVDESAVAVVGEAVEVGNETVGNVDVDLGGVAVDLDSVDLNNEIALGENTNFNSAELGEVVEIGGLSEIGDQTAGTVVTAADVFLDESVVVVPGAELENRSVTLSDPEILNPVATEIGAVGEPVALNTYNPDTGWEVQIVGDTREVPDSTGAVESVALLNESSSSEFTIDDVAVGSGSDGAVASSSDRSQIQVNQNDTLWEIAEANSIGGLSTHQMMLALLEANQQAFINGNINLVKAGATLQIPEASSVSRLTQAQAIAQVGEQERLWRDYRDNLRGVQSGSTRLASLDSQSSDALPTAADSNTEAEVPETATSEAAQRILEEAREEVLRAQNELSIVADNSSTSTVASATADESRNPDTERLGSVNQKLQLAREELAAARLESEELASQSTELENVTSNMDQLVTLQEDKLAKLQAQLADAQNRENLAAVETEAEDQANTLAALANEGVADATAAVEQGAAELTDSAEQLVDQIPGGADDAVAATSLTGADTDAEPIQLAGTDETDNTALEQVEAAAAVTTADTTPAPVNAPWYQKFITDPRYIAGGVGGIGLLGLLMMLRRRKAPVDEDILDQVEFIDDENDFVAGGGSAVTAEVAADMTGENVNLDATGSFDSNLDEFAETSPQVSAEQTVDLDSLVLPESDAEIANDVGDDTGVGDDTISEAEVYLAYGLHGQAEDLLTKAVEKNPGNAEYRVKLMQTYHAQNNQTAFVDAAGSYHNDFGGTASPDWESIREIGQEVDPSNALFLSNTDDLESVGKGNFDAPKLDSNDFLSEDDVDTGVGAASQVREFSSDEAAVADIEEDESDLMDQSLDPGFAFDESDLEATGDFTSIADEINQEEAANESSTKPMADDGIIEFDAPELTTLDETQAELDKAEEDSLAQDLSMDLEQLSGDMDLDSTASIDDGLELTDLTGGDDLGTDMAAGGDVDEMDTMLDLAKAYIDMGDNDSASSALGEIVKSGSPEQKTEAENLLRKMS